MSTEPVTVDELVKLLTILKLDALDDRGRYHKLQHVIGRINACGIAPPEGYSMVKIEDCDFCNSTGYVVTAINLTTRK